MRERLRSLRRQVYEVGVSVSVGLLAAGATHTGLRRRCKAKEAVADTILMHVQRGDVSRRFVDVMELSVVILDASHAAGHLLRDEHDGAATRDVMRQFRAIMKQPVGSVRR